MRVLVTGANGFVGRAVCKALSGAGHFVRGAVRERKNTSYINNVPFNGELISIGDIGPNTKWEKALQGIDTVVHLAARVHVMKDASANPLTEYRHVNSEGTRQLARIAAESGVRRIVYVSTIKVNGETTQNMPFTEGDEPNPQDAYAVSKLEAEQALQAIAQKTGLEFVILRPPLVYGPGVRANFLKLMKLVDSGIPLPFGRVSNSRSLIHIGNLVDAIIKCIQHPSAANKTFLVSDGEDLSTPELIRRLASALNKPAHLVPFSSSLLRLAGAVTRKSAEVERLTASLVIDSLKIRRELNWTPPFTVDEGLKHTAEWFRSNEKDI
ncbi:MAG: UDP-glucose 4-epimerase family protein [Nitrospirota bacterium]